MAEKLRAPVVVLLLAGIVWLVGVSFENEEIRETCTSGATVLAVVALVLGVVALLKKD